MPHQKLLSGPAIAALFLYGLLPIVRGTHAGLIGIAPELAESARALGLPDRAALRLVQLPLASRSTLRDSSMIRSKRRRMDGPSSGPSQVFST